jgi:hypothetical protein
MHIDCSDKGKVGNDTAAVNQIFRRYTLGDLNGISYPVGQEQAGCL